ncbi:MAG TPA: alpha-2-macroglobulin [Thermodesulfobacteriota bacterium]|nr:alpha-2-macroglobulin [Thermodesulfobacteriota bacterium]
MSEPNSDKPKRIFQDWKNIAIAILVIVVVVMGFILGKDRLGGGVKETGVDGKGEGVAIFDVKFDRENQSFVDIVFDKPIGKDKEGEILGRDPAKITPTIGGVWKWQGSNVLRFEPSGNFAPATDYTITIIPEQIISQGQVFKGKKEISFRTDEFKVEQVTINEEPFLEKKNTLALVGEVRFNYSVDPEVLARKIKLIDLKGGVDGQEKRIPIKLETTYWSDVINFKSDPIEKEKDERKLKLIILGDLVPAQGNVPLGQDYTETILLGSKDKLVVREVSPEAAYKKSSLKITFSSSVNPEIAASYITVKPEVKYTLERDRNRLNLRGEFKPGETYELAMGKGLPAIDDAVLREEYKTEVTIPDLEPSVEFESKGMFLDAKGTHAVKLKTINIDSLELDIDRVYLNNLFFLFDSYGYSVWRDNYYKGDLNYSLGNSIVNKEIKMQKKQNEEVVTTLNLNKYIPEGEPGLYRIGITPEGLYEGVQKWVLITDLGIVAKKGSGEFLVWVSSFANLQPISGAEVKVISNQNQLIAKGITDANGLLRLEGLQKPFEKNTPYMITVEKGRDFSFLLTEQMAIDTSGLDVGGATFTAKGYTAYVYGERDIYRPGETLEAVAIVRDSNLNVPEPMPLIIGHKDPKGRISKTMKENVTAGGLLPFSLSVPAYAPTGYHTVEIVAGDETIGQYRFQVEEFVPDRIKVAVEEEKKSVLPGEEMRYKVRGTYLFGPPAAGLSVDTQVTLIPKDFAPKGYEAYVFINPERKFDPRQIFSERGKLNEEGIKEFAAKVPEDLRPPSSLEAWITARVQETGGRGVAARNIINVHPYPFYLGIKRKDRSQYADPGKEVVLEYVALSPGEADSELKEVKTDTLRAEFFIDRWNTVLRRTPAGNYKYESIRDSALLESKILEGGSSKGSFGFTPSEFGSYRVVLTDPKGGASTEVQFYASGWGFSAWAIENPARVELDLEEDEYMPGERAVLQVRAPFSGKLLVTVERDEIYHTEIHTLSGNSAKLSIPVTELYRPNAYITATVIRSAKDLEPGSPGRAFGAIPINVDRSANRIGVDIKAPEEIRPLTPLEIEVSTIPEASVTVAAVDEGILQLIAQKTPDPFSFFYQKLALGVMEYDTFSLLLPDVPKIEGASPPGGGADALKAGQFVRTEGIRRVKPVAFWSGVLKTDANGRLKVKFDIPEFQGAIRIMAVASKDKRFGSGESFTGVKSPLVMFPTIPRFLSLNETVVIPVSVRNDTGKDGTFKVQLDLLGALGIEGERDNEQKKQSIKEIAIPNGSERTVYFTITTFDETGNVSLNISASGNGETTSSTTDLSIRPDLPVERMEKAGRIAGQTTELGIEDEGSFRPETIKRELRLSRLPLIQFSGKLDYLLNYPYGCLEQVTSTVFPLLYLADISRELEPELFEKSNPEALVQEGIRRMVTMQITGGGFSLWPGGTSVEPWASIYAAHFLVEARRAGYYVENSLYSGAIDFTKSEAKAKQSYGTGELERAVYALYVLGRAGKADTGTMDYIRKNGKDQLGVESRALLGATYASMGNTEAIKEMTKGLEDVERINRETGGNFNSTVRNRALFLLALMDAAPNDPRAPELVERLARDATVDTWWTTQETSFALLAIGQFIKRQTQAPPYTGTVYLGDKSIAEFKSDKVLAIPEIEGTEPVKIVMDNGYKEGSAFYSIITSAVPTDKGFKPVQNGLELKKEYHTQDGVPIDPNNIKQGDLLVVRTDVRSMSGRLQNVVIQNLLPSGFEVENPRLKTTEILPWATGEKLEPDYQDIRDDRVLIFTDLNDNKWYSYYTLLRVVNPGVFSVPPVQAEAMYAPNIRFTGGLEKPFRVEIKN